MIYHQIPTQMATDFKTDNIQQRQSWTTWNLYSLCVEMYTATWENYQYLLGLTVPMLYDPQIPPLRVCLIDMHTYVHVL